MQTAALPRAAANTPVDGSNFSFARWIPIPDDIISMAVTETKIETVRLKINALERLRILGDPAITVLPLARYRSCLNATTVKTKNHIKDCRPSQPSSTATSPHGVSLRPLTSSAALLNGYHGSALANQTRETNATRLRLFLNPIRSEVQNPIALPAIDTWLAFLVRPRAHIDLRPTHTTAPWCEYLTRIRDR